MFVSYRYLRNFKMASSTSSLSSLLTVASFSGQSKYSQDFQNVLARAVQLQGLNLENLQQSQQDQSAKQAALQALDSKFSTLQQTLSTLTNATGLASLSASVSDSSASISLSAGASPATYTLEVLSLGSNSQSISDAGLGQVTDPSTSNISMSSSFTLTVDGTDCTITPQAPTLQALVNSINRNSALGVSASIVNVGNSGSPDYRLSLQANDLGPISIQLNDGTTDLMNSVKTGSLAEYKVDGLPQTITSNSDQVTLAPGVTATLQNVNIGSPATITITSNTSSLQSALKSFVTAYNGVVDQLGASHGKSGNALQGDTVIFGAQQALRSINTFTGTNGSPVSLLGLDLDNTGHLTFNAAELQVSASQGISALTAFLGDSSTGFLHAANSALQTVEDPIVGTIKVEETQLTKSINKLNDSINDEVDRINNFQQNLLLQLSQADAAIYQLQNQQTLFKGLFDSNNNDN
jgi:flagellar hook-associated protein 2